MHKERHTRGRLLVIVIQFRDRRMFRLFMHIT